MPWAVGVAVAGAVAISYCLALLAIRIAPSLGLVDRPDGDRKRHPNTTPLMGGVAVYLTLLILAPFVCSSDRWWLSDETQEPFNLLMLLVSGGLFCALGLVDDRWQLRARCKFSLQIAASLPFAIWGRSIDAIDFLGLHVQLGFWATLFTVLWLVAFSNVMNLIDGLDGLAGTVGLVVLLTFAALAGIRGQVVVAIFSLVLAGSLLGFLIHNWHPAKIFLGDAGSLTVGFLIGALSIESWLKQAAGFTLIVPLVLVSIPMFDTMMAIVRRKLTGRSVGQADHAHIHHRLQDRGLTPRQVVLSLAGLCLAMAMVAIASVAFDSDLLAVGLCASILVLLVVGRIFGHHEVLLFSRQLRGLGLLIGDATRWLLSHLVVFRLTDAVVEQRRHSWQTVCHRVEELGGVNLEFVCHGDRDHTTIATLRWQSSDERVASNNAWAFSFSVRRADDRQTTLSVRGESGPHAGELPLGELLDLLTHFCETWPLDESTTAIENGRSPEASPPEGAIAGRIGPRAPGGQPRRKAA